MNKSILSIALLFIITISRAQTTAMPFSGLDCNGNAVDLSADLDAGKAVVLFFYMANCGSCPPVAHKIQTMANNINASCPGMVKGYAFPYINSTTCSYSSSWVSSNGLSLYTPMDSGATQVAHYGGFGMPTVVLLGGMDHHVMFSTLSFSTSDTTIMRDSIMVLYNVMNPSGIADLLNPISSFKVYPNPASDHISIAIELKESTNLLVDVSDISGKQLIKIMEGKQSGSIAKQWNTASLPNGNYLVRLQANGKTSTQKFSVTH
jgi:hypothetical protein